MVGVDFCDESRLLFFVFIRNESLDSPKYNIG